MTKSSFTNDPCELQKKPPKKTHTPLQSNYQFAQHPADRQDLGTNLTISLKELEMVQCQCPLVKVRFCQLTRIAYSC